jgi:hypothetical protein
MKKLLTLDTSGGYTTGCLFTHCLVLCCLIINLIPIIESKNECPLLGIAADCGFTVEDFLARKREEKVLEGV